MSEHYVPPRQGGFGQLVDCVFLLAALFLSLMAPLLLSPPAAPGGAAPAAAEAAARPTWADLKQNATAQAQWERLGFDPAKAQPIIETRADYAIEPISLGLTAVVIIGYFLFVVRFSDREYRQVIAERFGVRN